MDVVSGELGTPGRGLGCVGTPGRGLGCVTLKSIGPHTISHHQAVVEPYSNTDQPRCHVAANHCL